MKNAAADKSEDTNSEITDVSEIDEVSERRRHPDSKARDRRVIARFSDASMRFHMVQIHRLLKLWIGFGVFFAFTIVAVQFYNDWYTSQRSIFFAMMVLTLAFAVYRVSRAALSYTENESQARMGNFVESCFFMFIAMAILTTVFGVVHLITLF
jgi:hypothetical protein